MGGEGERRGGDAGVNMCVWGEREGWGEGGVGKKGGREEKDDITEDKRQTVF
jgi:hypothetical protein